VSAAGWLLVLAGAVGAGIAVRRRRARVRWQKLLRADPGRPVVSSGSPAQSAATPTLRLWRDRLAESMMDSPLWIVLLMSAAGTGGVGLTLAGPVAGLVLAAYGVVGVSAWRRRIRRQAEDRSRARAVEAVSALAAELRAGQSVPTALAGSAAHLAGSALLGAAAVRVARRVDAAVEVAQASGAALADVLDRLDADLRAVERSRASAQAQAAGAQASALLLAVMPVAGVGLGYLIGADPWRILLHTPLGVGCLVGAMVLQLSGLAWAARLARVEVPV
jgi:tight adherence protein B